MANPRVTIEGRLGGDPELRFTQNGKPVASLRVVTHDNKREGDGWQEVDTTWWPVTVWDKLAENVVESLVKGDLVVVHGRLRDREWTDRENNRRTEKEIIADAVGASLRFRIQRHGEPAQTSPNGPQQPPGGQQQGHQGYGTDPWAQQRQPAGQQQGGWPPPQDEPPF